VVVRGRNRERGEGEWGNGGMGTNISWGGGPELGL
jgi:hypothetical protein